jgi:hypothetical protein
VQSQPEGSRGFTPDYARRLDVFIRANKRGGRGLSRQHYRWLAVEHFASEIERVSGRHVTARFVELATEAVRQGLKRPSEAEVQRSARRVLDGIRKREEVAASERADAETIAADPEVARLAKEAGLTLAPMPVSGCRSIIRDRVLFYDAAAMRSAASIEWLRAMLRRELRRQAAEQAEVLS